MFEGWGKSKFYNKCKVAIKVMKTRVQMIKKKRNATQKYMKNDIAELLRNGLDIHAYGRTEGLLAEMNLSSCYDLVEQFSMHILNNLSVMSKQRECPEDCREAVSSLMYAAARFADLPELRELRTLFARRYEKSVDCFVSKELIQRFKSAPPTNDMKVQLMQDIATEAGLDWNRKTTEQKLYKPPDAEQNVTNDDDGSARRIEHHLSHNVERKTSSKDIEWDYRGGKGQEIEPEITSNDSEEEFDEGKALSYKSIPPPYTKSKADQTQNKDERQQRPEQLGLSENKDMQHPDDSAREHRQKPQSVRRWHSKPGSGNNDDDQSDEEERMIDRLLRYYSRKKSPHGKDKSEPVVEPPTQQPTFSSGRATRRFPSWDVSPSISSFHIEPPSNPSETKRGHARAASLQPEMLNPGHLHPKLPDYDEFVARLASLRGGNAD